MRAAAGWMRGIGRRSVAPHQGAIAAASVSGSVLASKKPRVSRPTSGCACDPGQTLQRRMECATTLTAMSKIELNKRRSARVILRSPAGEVLLIEFVTLRASGNFRFWATPGGEVEDDESDIAAAGRELREELGLDLELEGPVHFVSSEFEHNGTLTSNTDVFFTARCPREAPRLDPPTEQERAVMRRIQWWTLDEIAHSEATVFPSDLAAAVRRLSPELG